MGSSHHARLDDFLGDAPLDEAVLDGLLAPPTRGGWSQIRKRWRGKKRGVARDLVDSITHRARIQLHVTLDRMSEGW